MRNRLREKEWVHYPKRKKEKDMLGKRSGYTTHNGKKKEQEKDDKGSKTQTPSLPWTYFFLYFGFSNRNIVQNQVIGI